MKKSALQQSWAFILRVSRRKHGVALVMVLILLIFAFLLATAAVAYVYASSMTTSTKEHRMLALEYAETGLNTGLKDVNTLHAVLPLEITLPVGATHAEYVEFLEAQGEDYYIESGNHRYYLTDDDKIVGYGQQINYKRIIRCDYLPYYKPAEGAPAALYMDANTVNSNYNGNSFKIDGNDHTATGGNNPGGIDKYGVVTTDPNASTGVIAGLAGKQKNRVTGLGANPSVGTDTTVPVDIDAYSAQLDAIADIIYPTSVKLAGDEFSMGSADYPITAIINGDLEVTGNFSGWGILDIRGSLLAGHGTVVWTGLMIVHGEQTWISGTPDVIGSLWVKSDNVTLRISGNPSIFYSSEALSFYGNPGYYLDFTTWEEL